MNPYQQANVSTELALLRHAMAQARLRPARGIGGPGAIAPSDQVDENVYVPGMPLEPHLRSDYSDPAATRPGAPGANRPGAHDPALTRPGRPGGNRPGGSANPLSSQHVTRPPEYGGPGSLGNEIAPMGPLPPKPVGAAGPPMTQPPPIKPPPSPQLHPGRRMDYGVNLSAINPNDRTGISTLYQEQQR